MGNLSVPPVDSCIKIVLYFGVALYQGNTVLTTVPEE